MILYLKNEGETMSNVKNDAICSMDKDFAQWYTDVCRKAELMDYSSVKGFIIYRPYGYAIWENIQKELDQKFKASGHENVYMPMLIPTSLLQKEADHVEGFAPECAVVTKGGLEDLEEPLVIRPTSETLFCEHYAKIVNSYRDLPKNIINGVVSSVGKKQRDHSYVEVNSCGKKGIPFTRRKKKQKVKPYKCYRFIKILVKIYLQFQWLQVLKRKKKSLPVRKKPIPLKL